MLSVAKFHLENCPVSDLWDLFTDSGKLELFSVGSPSVRYVWAGALGVGLKVCSGVGSWAALT